MARYAATVDSSRSAQTNFDDLADFTTVAEWDPGIDRCERLDDRPLGVGARFRVTMTMLGRESQLDYEVVEYQAPRRIVLHGRNSTVDSRDTITVDARDSGSAVTYEAVLTGRGLVRFADPLLALMLRRLGAKAERGLRARVG